MLGALLCFCIVAAGAQALPDSLDTDSAGSRRRGVAYVAGSSATVGLSDVLVGQVPGLRVTPGPGVGPAGARLRVRGLQTIHEGRGPLVLVDGVRIVTSMSGWLVGSSLPGAPRVDDLRSWEIEDIAVVPGAAAAGIYGADAANGVVVVRTRSGQAGPPQWQFFAGAGTTRPFAWPSGLGGYDADHADSLMRRGGCTLQLVATGYCAQDSIGGRSPTIGNRQLGSAWQRRLGLSVTGGWRRLDYFAGWEFAGDGGIVALASEETNRLRALGQPVRPTTLNPDRGGHSTARMNLRFRPAETIELRARVARAWGEWRVPPTALAVRGPRVCCDPLPLDASTAMAYDFMPATTLQVARWTSALSAAWRPVRGFTVVGLLGHDATGQDQFSWLRRGEGYVPPGFLNLGFRSTESRPDRIRTIALSAEYAYRVSSLITATSTVGLQRERIQRDYFQAIGRDVPPDSVAPSSQITVHEVRNDHGLFARQQLNVGRRLSVSGVIRRDDFGYGPGAMQPSVSASWLARPGADPLWVHAAYGSATRWPLSPQAPERTVEATAGAAGSLGRGRATFDLTLYDMRSRVYVNSGTADLSNRGIELTVLAKVLHTPRRSLDIGLGVWGNRNRIRSMTVAPFFLGRHLFLPGYPVGWYRAEGVPPFVDANGDGIIASSELVLTPDLPFVEAGTPYPTQGASLTTRFSVGSWLSLGATLEYQAGHTLFNDPAWSRCLGGACRGAVDRATPLATQAEVAYRGQTLMYFEDADFAKLRSLTLTLTAPSRLAAAMRVRVVALTVTGRNLITWTGYSGLDPEPVGRDPDTGGIESLSDAFAFPALPHWSFIVRLTY